VCHALLRDASLYDQLLTFDHDLADKARRAGCGVCGGRLHSARYPRKPRGGLEDLGPDYTTRLSFCCAVDGCRRRTTPPSVRYLGRRVYLGAVVVLISALSGGITATRAAQLREWLGVSVRTLKRWRAWWRATFVASAFWRGAQARFMPPVVIEALPASLLERFAGDARTRLRHTLGFLTPLTTRRADRDARSAMAGGGPQTMPLVPGRRRS
jgi:hypothetical protein